MNYAAGLVALGVIAVLYIVYRVAQKAFNVLFIVIFVHAYIVLIDRVYPDVSLLRIVYGSSSCSCSNQTSPLPIHIELPVELTQLSDTITEQVQSKWGNWLPSFLTPSSTMPSSPAVETQSVDTESKPKPKSTANTKVKDEFEEFQRWKASQKDL